MECEKHETLIVIPPYPRKGLSYSLGAGYIISSMRAAGRAAALLDFPCADFESGARGLLDIIARSAPSLIGFSLNTSLNILYAYDFLEMARRAAPRAKIVAGGLHATLQPAEVLDAGFDAVVLGDGEETFPALAARYASGDDLKGISGLAWREPDGARYIGRPAYVSDLDSLHPPANRFFSETGRPGDLQLILLLSRGCFRKCSFCVERHLNRGVRYRSADNVYAEIEDAALNHSVSRLHFIDSSFLENVELIRRLCDKLSGLRRRTPIEWKCMARADHLDGETLQLMKDAGCSDIFIGMESANEDTLRLLRKRIRPEDNERAIRLCNDAGINVHGYFITGLPWETTGHLQNNLDFMEKHRGRCSFTFFIPVPFPGTQLYQDFHREFGFTGWWLEDRLEPLEKAGMPLFRWLRTRDPFLERDFFNYPPAIREMLCRFPLSTRHAVHRTGWKMTLSRAAQGVSSLASRVLFLFSPRLENRVMKPLYRRFGPAAARMKTSREEHAFDTSR